MRFKVSRESFLSSLPDSERVIIKRSVDLPDFYHFDGELETGIPAKAPKIVQVYPELAKLTRIEFLIFSAIYSDSGAFITNLKECLRYGGRTDNAVVVHIKSIRKKLKGIFTVETIRQPWLECTVYRAYTKAPPRA